MGRGDCVRPGGGEDLSGKVPLTSGLHEVGHREGGRLRKGGERESVWGSPELDGDKCLEDGWWLGRLGFF